MTGRGAMLRFLRRRYFRKDDAQIGRAFIFPKILNGRTGEGRQT